MYCHKFLILLAASAIVLCAAPATAMRSQHDPVAPSLGVSQDAPAFHSPALQILLAQAQAPGRPLTTREQEIIRAPERPVRDPVVRSEPPPPSRPGNPFPPRPANEPRLTNPLSR